MFTKINVTRLTRGVFLTATLCSASFALSAEPSQSLSTAGPDVEVVAGRASTANESRQRGRADLFRGDGYRNYWNSEAALNMQQVRSQAVDNHLKYVASKYELRKMNQEYVASLKKPHVTPEQLSRISRAAIPERATFSQIDPQQGKIRWPEALCDERFGGSRKKLNELFAARSLAPTQFNSQSRQAVQDATAAMKDALSAQIRQYGTADYLAARKFLETLSYEARFAADAGPALAAN
jgi:hypothetical protein